MKAPLILLTGVMLFSHLAKAQPCDLEIRHQKLESQKDFLIFDLLQLSLSKTGQTTCFHELEGEQLTAARKTLEIREQRLSIKWASVGLDNEAQLRAVRLPIFKGLIGYRILVIRQGEQERFAKLNTIDDLRQFSTGVGERWGDRAVLEAANLPLVMSSRGRYLWNMLVRKRFDYMALGVHEPWQNIYRFKGELEVENRLMLVYPMAFYFYVNKQDEQLYQALKQGMEAAIKDGSYDRMLYQSSMMRETVAKAKLLGRHIIHLENPYLPKDTPLHRKELWLDPKTLEQEVIRANEH